MHTALSQLTAGGFGIGIEAPLDNDWTSAGEYARQRAGRLPGEPDLERHADLARQQPGLAVLPNLSSALPLIVAGLAQQSPAVRKHTPPSFTWTRTSIPVKQCGAGVLASRVAAMR